MKSFLLSLALAYCFVASAVVAQSTPINGEFVESTSPLRNGGTVTTRSEPGRRVQTTVTIASLPISRDTSARAPVARTASAGLGQNAGLRNTQSVLNSNNNASTASTLSNTSGRYPYPATYSPRVAYNPNLAAANQQRINTARAQFPNNCNCGPTTAVNGLGLTAAPVYNPLPGTQVNRANFQTSGAFVGPNNQPVLSQPPSLQFDVPGQQPSQFGQVGVPQFGNPNANWTRSPWLSGTQGAYQPLVRVFNMPQGTFIGQGIVGSPEAYVNGQPILNFFRYVLPF